MHRSIRILLGVPRAPLGPEMNAQPAPGAHWRRWRHGGAALSALLHGAVVAALTMSVPVFGGSSTEKAEIPVEIVPRAPERKAEEKKPEMREAKTIPEPPKPETPAPLPAAKPAPAPAPAAPLPEAPPRTLAPPPTPPAWTGFEPRVLPEPHALPEPPRPQGPAAGLKVDADEIPPPSDKKGLGYWVLEPLVVNLRHPCGLANISGVLELQQRLAEGRYRGTMRTRITWSACPPEGVVHQVELRIKGGEVELVGASGF